MYSSQPWLGRQSARPQEVRPRQQELAGPVEKLYQVSLSQGWGAPQYTVSSFLDSAGQQMFQYSVSAVPHDASPDRHIAMINAAW